MGLRIEPFEEGREERFIHLVKNATDILVVSPFVSYGASQLLLSGSKRRNIRIITRFNLEDFVVGVSQLRALESLVKAGARIRGRQGLHSKLYLFDNKSIIVSSANLTRGGLIHNLEFGLEIEGHRIVTAARSYFERLWDVSENDLTLALISKWKDEVDDERARRGHNKQSKGQLPDYGTELTPQSPTEDIPLTKLNTAQSELGSSENPKVYVKFFGTGVERWDAQQKHVREVLQRSECYYACTYPRNKRPRRISHGDIIYMAFITKNPIGYAIFGRALAIPHQPGRDDATLNEIARQDWKNDWPHYVRVFDPVFIDAPLAECVWLAPIIEKLGPQVFASTARNLVEGGNTDPMRSLRQKPDVELTPDGARLLSAQFEEKLRIRDPIPKSFLNDLPKSDIQLGSG